MSYYRYQNSSFHRPSFFGGFSFFPPVIKALMISNVAIYLFADLVARFTVGGVPIASSVQQLLFLFPLRDGFQLWQLVTYMFMHGGFMHLLFNMFALWMFGVELENQWGSKSFLIFYLVCGVGAGISNLLIAPLFTATAPTVGASGAIYGILIAYGVLFPERPIFLYFFLPIRAKYLVMAYIALELYAGVTGTADGVAHFAHLGGAAVGFIMLMVDRRSAGLPPFLQRIRDKLAEPSRVRQFTGYQRENVTDAKYYDIHDRDSDEGVNQQKIDEILDKINMHGYQSLTEEEKRILFEASKKLS